MKTREDYKNFVDTSIETLRTIEETSKKAVFDIVKANGGIVFDYMNGNAPCAVSCSFGDDIADCYITYLYCEGETLYADLYAYYLEEDRSGVDLAFDEPNTDWLCILEYIVEQHQEPLQMPEC